MTALDAIHAPLGAQLALPAVAPAITDPVAGSLAGWIDSAGAHFLGAENWTQVKKAAAAFIYAVEHPGGGADKRAFVVSALRSWVQHMGFWPANPLASWGLSWLLGFAVDSVVAYWNHAGWPPATGSA